MTIQEINFIRSYDNHFFIKQAITVNYVEAFISFSIVTVNFIQVHHSLVFTLVNDANIIPLKFTNVNTKSKKIYSVVKPWSIQETLPNSAVYNLPNNDNRSRFRCFDGTKTPISSILNPVTRLCSLNTIGFFKILGC